MTWQNLITTLDAMHHHAKSEADTAPQNLEKTIVRLGEVAKDLQSATPPDQTTFLQIHASLNRLGNALPAERAAIRQKITGLLKRSQAQQAYSNMADK